MPEPVFDGVEVDIGRPTWVTVGGERTVFYGSPKCQRAWAVDYGDSDALAFWREPRD